MELVGPYAGSGAQEGRYLVRRPDGGMVLLSPLLFAVATMLARTSDLSEAARGAGDRVGRQISPAGVRYLIDHKLRPLGLVVGSVAPAGGAPLLSLAVRRTLLPAPLVAKVARWLAPLFATPVWATVVTGSWVLACWLALARPVDPDRWLGHDPAVVLAVLGLTLVGGLWHELGHAAAASYGGAKPGPIGAGIYIVWPAFFSNLTDSYRLDRVSRIRTDLGGVYFNLIFALALVGVYAAGGPPALLVAAAVQLVLVLLQFVPFLRLDGYYLLSDLSGVPNLFGLLARTSRGVRHGRVPNELSALRTGVQLFAIYWMVLATGLLLAAVTWTMLRAPRVLSAFAELLAAYRDGLRTAVEAGSAAAAAAAAAGLVLVGVQAAGVSVMLLRGGAGLAAGVSRRARASRVAALGRRQSLTLGG